MEDLGIVISILALIVAPLASWVIINRKIATLISGYKSLEKQLTGVELECKDSRGRLELDYKERLSELKTDLKEHKDSTNKNYLSIMTKIDDNDEKLSIKLDAIKDEIAILKVKLAK